MARPGCYEARIASVTAAGAMVTISGLTGPRERQGPLPYMPRAQDDGAGGVELAEPVRGDRCWVLLDEDDQPACIAVWEPSA